jgi:hypothetical protein
MLPDCWPWTPEGVAGENFRVVDGSFNTHAVRDADLCGNGAVHEVEFLTVEFSANYDNGFRFVVAVAPVVKAAGAADGRGQVVLRPKSDSARLGRPPGAWLTHQQKTV